MKEFLWKIYDLFLHLDRAFLLVSEQYGSWTYGLLFLIIFCETGLVVMPFLPGDSLLFAAGAFAAAGKISLVKIWLLSWIAAVLGDALNYVIGRKVGAKLFARPDSRLFRRDYFLRAQAFYAKYGAQAIVLARFAPIIRTFVPFVAGVAGMEYRRFSIYNIVGGGVWVTTMTLAGYFFGTLPWVQQHFSSVVVAIILVSLAPFFVEFWRARRREG